MFPKIEQHPKDWLCYTFEELEQQFRLATKERTINSLQQTSQFEMCTQSLTREAGRENDRLGLRGFIDLTSPKRWLVHDHFYSQQIISFSTTNIWKQIAVKRNA